MIPSRSDLTELSDRDGISVEENNSHLLVRIRYSDESDPHHLTESLAAVLRTVENAGGSLTRLDADEPDLERLFLKMTGSRLRD